MSRVRNDRILPELSVTKMTHGERRCNVPLAMLTGCRNKFNEQFLGHSVQVGSFSSHQKQFAQFC
jgi:hypothetical protein